MDEVLEKRANEFRYRCGISLNEAMPLKSLLYKLDVMTVFKPLSGNMSGMALKTHDGTTTDRFILVNSAKSCGSQHFTICHELYHLYIQENFTSRVCETGVYLKTDREEYNADMFASYLLLPEQGVKSLIPDHEFGKNKITMPTILKIEHFFCSSRAALLYRLKGLKLIDEELRLQYAGQVMRSALEFGYSTELYKPGNDNLVIGDYGALARSLFEKGDISESNYFSLLLDLGMNVTELENLENGGEEQ
ncbi:ImmA/IrrE family metallo-endopeptidase [Mucilaginibacter sp.]|uniref:ImmA/IrrE family metallo-endopeptidase n=1 Tax=Mucilaginibacter sp. TaxID=1882438 RepID=UPI0025E5407F|nr:ImmA/IrrE family metallo-endopeptidase [Mucilaginibacter sp.]